MNSISKVLIVEGSDLAGKTTVINRLTNLLVEGRQSFCFRHFGLLPESWDYRNDYIKALLPASQLGIPVVLDRFTDSEIVYGNVYRDGPNAKFNEDAQKEVYGALEELRAVVVYCHASREEISTRFEKRGDKVYKLPTILSVASEFEKLYKYEEPHVEQDQSLSPMISFTTHWYSDKIVLVTVKTDVPVHEQAIELIASLLGESQSEDHAIT